MLLREFEPFENETQAKKNVVEAIKSVAAQLGNTPTVCRKCYVHPAVLDNYLNGTMIAAIEAEVEQEVEKRLKALRDEEFALLRLLRHSGDSRNESHATP